MKNMIICGATGFIGKNLVEYFSKKNNYKITAIYNNIEPNKNYKNVIWKKADLRNKNEVDSILKDANIVLQFAATTSGSKDIVNKPYIHVTDNAIMNSIILRSCFDNNVSHFIFPSCTVMYQPSEVPLKETDFDESQDIFPTYFGVGNTKVYIEKMAKFFANFNKTKHTIIRHSNVYGPHDKYDLEKSHMFGATITKVLKPKNNKIVVWGKGEEARDLIYVDDLINFVDLALKNQKQNYELFNVGIGKAIKVKEIVEKIIKFSGNNLSIEYDLTKPTIPTSLSLNCEKAHEKLGWVPKVDLEEGILKTINWYKNNILK